MFASLPWREGNILSYKKAQSNLDWSCVQRKSIREGALSGQQAISYYFVHFYSYTNHAPSHQRYLKVFM